MELPKETIERIEKYALEIWPIALVHIGDKTNDKNLIPRTERILGMKSEALRSLKEKEELLARIKQLEEALKAK